MITPQRAAEFFLPIHEIPHIGPLGAGNVNDTWLITLESGAKRVLQRLSPAVFNNPCLIMANMRIVTRHLLQQDAAGIEFIRLFQGQNGADFFIDQDQACWRMLSYIASSRTLNNITSPVQAAGLGRMLGRFHLMVSELDPALLADPLPGFHVTPRYLDRYDVVLDTITPAGHEEEFCLRFIEQERSHAGILEQARGDLKQQVIHGDPKVANFLFDIHSDQVKSLIDLDTVGPDLLLYDLGDFLRSCCNPLGEEVASPASVQFDANLFQHGVAGYMHAAGMLLGPRDRELLMDAVRLITFELGLRFFTDHLEDNRYFKVNSPDQNLRRALVQFYLVSSIDEQRHTLAACIA